MNNDSSSFAFCHILTYIPQMQVNVQGKSGKINEENWNISYYQKGLAQVRIYLQADYQKEGPTTHYAITQEENSESRECQTFSDLREACHFINANYQNWELHTLKSPQKSGSGCDSCQAH